MLNYSGLLETLLAILNGDEEMRVLIVEDEVKAAHFLAKGLKEQGFAVDIAVNGKEGLALSRSNLYDIIILDIMLPEMDGWNVIGSLRRSGNQTPVIFLTAQDAVAQRVRGLELGADDYLVKPFVFSELLARIRTVLRRGQSVSPEILRVADLELDTKAMRVTRAGRRLDLTAKEYALLALLMRSTGEVLSRMRIAERIWNLDFGNDSNVVDVHMRRLRVKVDEPYDIKLIHTVRGAGYVLEER
jgi:two-component system copper resistance phosphate regulon response regulator CusR